MPELRIAFLVLAHDDAPQLERLCRALQPHSVFVHVDGKNADFPFDRITKLPGVTLVRPSIKVHWGDYSMVEATLALIEKARETGVFERYVLLSGACYPVKPMTSLEAAFEMDPHREWINLTRIKRDSHLEHLIGRRWRLAPLVQMRSLDARLRLMWNKISKTMGRDLEREIKMTPYYGSQWWALTDGCVAVIMDFVHSHALFVKAYRSVYAPDEHFFHTIVGNSSFAAFANQVDDHGAATNQFIPLHLLSTSKDRYWGPGDEGFAEIAATPQYFIRKVSANRCALLLDRIDGELLRSDSSVQLSASNEEPAKVDPRLVADPEPKT